jgi:hypothetical protein
LIVAIDAVEGAPVVVPVDDPVVTPVVAPVEEPVDDPVVAPVDDPVVVPVDDAVAPPLVDPPLPPHPTIMAPNASVAAVVANMVLRFIVVALSMR